MAGKLRSFGMEEKKSEKIQTRFLFDRKNWSGATTKRLRNVPQFSRWGGGGERVPITSDDSYTERKLVEVHETYIKQISVLTTLNYYESIKKCT